MYENGKIDDFQTLFPSIASAMARIFLCYAREDEAQVRDVYRRL